MIQYFLVHPAHVAFFELQAKGHHQKNTARSLCGLQRWQRDLRKSPLRVVSTRILPLELGKLMSSKSLKTGGYLGSVPIHTCSFSKGAFSYSWRQDAALLADPVQTFSHFHFPLCVDCGSENRQLCAKICTASNQTWIIVWYQKLSIFPCQKMEKKK